MVEAVIDEKVDRPRRTARWIAVATAAGVLAGIIGTLGVQSAVSAIGAAQKDMRLVEAADACGAGVGVELNDEDRTMVIDVKGDEDATGASYDDQACILARLDIPGSVESHIGQTTSMDGRQSESWDGITIEWSYHPDRGSDMVITVDKD